MRPPRGRFAPTPSGYLHIGNAATALLSWLQIRHLNGEFVLRIENIDVTRLRPEYTEAILEDLRWLGIDWDEGPDVSGPYGPYQQHDRLERYEAVFAQLQDSTDVYPCFCSRAQLLAVSLAPHGLASEGPVYDGRCRRLTEAERRHRAKEKTPSWRFIVPDQPVMFDDLVCGPQRFPSGAGGDFVVRRADGLIGYQLAVVVDDAAMEITHVLRGDDLLDSTPRQMYLFRRFGFAPPMYAHVPLVLGPDGLRLSKRDASIQLHELRRCGVTPESLVGWLAYLCNLQDRPEPVQPRDLIAAFDLNKLQDGEIRLNEEFLKAMSRC